MASPPQRTSSFTAQYLAPLASVEPAILDVPAVACDSHTHVVASGATYPMVRGRSCTPPPAPEEKYLTMLAAAGMSREVLVQISV